jgi:type II secretory pathway pseudopilin PulG
MAAATARRATSQHGQTILTMLIVMAIVAVALHGTVALITYNVLVADYARNRQAATLAAENVLDRFATDRRDTGGSLETDLTGFSDVVVLDTQTGRVLPYTGASSLPAASVTIRRRWRFYVGADGVRHLAAAARAVSPSLEPLRRIGQQSWILVDMVQQV